MILRMHLIIYSKTLKILKKTILKSLIKSLYRFVDNSKAELFDIKREVPNYLLQRNKSRN